MKKDYPLKNREVDKRTAILRKAKCLRCAQIIFGNEHNEPHNLPKCKLLNLALDHMHPSGEGYGYWGIKDASFCPEGSWSEESLNGMEVVLVREKEEQQRHIRGLVEVGSEFVDSELVGKSKEEAEAVVRTFVSGGKMSATIGNMFLEKYEFEPIELITETKAGWNARRENAGINKPCIYAELGGITKCCGPTWICHNKDSEKTSKKVTGKYCLGACKVRKAP